MSVSASANPQLHHTRRNRPILRASALAGLLAAASVVACNDGITPMGATTRQVSSLNPGAVRGVFFCTAHLAPAGTHTAPTAVCTAPPAPRWGAHQSLRCHPREADRQRPAQSHQSRFDSTTRIFSLNVSITNLLAQPIGTTDGSTTDSTAVRASSRQGRSHQADRAP